LNSGSNPSAAQNIASGVGSRALTSAIAIFGNKYLREYGYDHWSIVSKELGSIGISWESK